MKHCAAPFLLCLLLALTLALGGIATARTAAAAPPPGAETRLIPCPDHEGAPGAEAHPGAMPVDLPLCARLLCDDCLRTGAVAILGSALAGRPRARAAMPPLPGARARPAPAMDDRPRSRAPPARGATS
jgi:hypothetical protein